MPAGTQAVNAFKAYTAASRHRRATFLVSADGAERREIAGRRPLGDARPIREGDVWANMARNLSRQPEQEGALAFLERAHAARRDATGALQAGLQPVEQRQAEGLAPTTLLPRLERQRVVTRVAAATQHLAEWAREQGMLLGELARLAPAVHDGVARAVEGLRPVIAQAASRVHNRPERVEARRRAAELAAAQEQLVALRMAQFRREQRWGSRYVDAGLERHWTEQARVEEGKQRETVRALTEADLRHTLRRESVAQRWEDRQQRRAAAQIKGPSPGW